MFVTMEERHYRIRFQHHNTDITWHSGDAPTSTNEATTCILEVQHRHRPQWEHIVSCTVARYHRDRPDRRIARREALAKTLRHSGLHKADRKPFWEAYLNRAQPKPAAHAV